MTVERGSWGFVPLSTPGASTDRKVQTASQGNLGGRFRVRVPNVYQGCTKAFGTRLMMADRIPAAVGSPSIATGSFVRIREKP
jgi:hypothetical protein